jgi:probable rRNA maturation factor
MTRAARRALTIDVLVASPRWKDDAGKVESMVRRAVTRAAAATLSTTSNELAIVLTDDSAIRLLNRDWRGIDAATNVLSFAAKKAGGKRFGAHLGDIVLAYETVAREARSEGTPFAHHVAHLAVHGFLHLVGYDHGREADATAMERTEREILRQLAIPDPYRPRKGNPTGNSTGNPAIYRARRVAKYRRKRRHKR